MSKSKKNKVRRYRLDSVTALELGCEINKSGRYRLSVEQENKLTKKDKTKVKLTLEQSTEYQDAVDRKVPPAKYYLVTWAQAETQIHKQFWQNMLAYADHIGAEIIVSAGRYKSPTSIEASEKLEDKEKNKSMWASDLRDYLYASRLELVDKLAVLCDVKVQPTAILPLSGLNGFTADSSSILPHPKVQLQSLPILEGYNHKLLMSTGAVTLPNYTDTKAGQKGKFHHQLGFVIVEKDEDEFHLRQVQADDSDGSFHDLWFNVKKGVVENIKLDSARATNHTVVFGDLHVGAHCQKSVALATQIANLLRARDVILHDVLDSKSINHHEEKDPFKVMQKEEDGTRSLENELEFTLDYLEKLDKNLSYSVLHNIESNHNNFLDRHLRSVDWRFSPNKKMYLKLANILVEGKAEKGLFNYLIDERFEGNRVLTHGYGDSLRISDWELGLHGDFGNAGSRGGLKQFKNLSTKTITGHSHSPAREDGAVVVGTLTKLRLGYNVGLSSWVNGVVVIYPNGKASNIHFINNKYTTLFEI